MNIYIYIHASAGRHSVWSSGQCNGYAASPSLASDYSKDRFQSDCFNFQDCVTKVTMMKVPFIITNILPTIRARIDFKVAVLTFKTVSLK